MSDTENNPATRLGGAEARLNGDTVVVELWYPRDRQAKKVQVGLVDVRAADAILVEYDFARDGWSIKQASCFEWAADDPVCDPDWQEVAFVEAWARERVPMGEPPSGPQLPPHED